MEPSAKRTADALGLGIATVKIIMADYNRDPKLLDEPAKMRGRHVHAVCASYKGAVHASIRSENTKGEYITLSNIRGFLNKISTDLSFHGATLGRTLNRVQKPTGKGELLIISFITIRRHCKSIRNKIVSPSDDQWQSVNLGTDFKRKHRHFKVYEEQVSLRNYDGLIRQIFIKDHGREDPSIIITNDNIVMMRLLGTQGVFQGVFEHK